MGKGAKPTVELGAGGGASPRVSRIRRDPPPLPTRTIVRYRREHEARIVALGILFFAIAIAIIIVNVSDYTA